MGTARGSAPHPFYFRAESGLLSQGRQAARFPSASVTFGEPNPMPLLPMEPSLYPDDLFAGPAVAPDGAERWWVLHTRPRAEKALARKILARRLPFFLPLHHRQWRSKGRLQSSYLPLFPGYVFLRGDDDARVLAL